jgi:hypothetical protein
LGGSSSCIFEEKKKERKPFSMKIHDLSKQQVDEKREEKSNVQSSAGMHSPKK